MTGERKFWKLDSSAKVFVKFGDETRVWIEGRGSIIFKYKKGEHWELKEVYFISRVCNNIISLGQLVQNGDRIVMYGSYMWVLDENCRLLMKVLQSKYRQYKNLFDEEESMCLLG